jgi:hypothetical protein
MMNAPLPIWNRDYTSTILWKTQFYPHYYTHMLHNIHNIQLTYPQAVDKDMHIIHNY